MIDHIEALGALRPVIAANIHQDLELAIRIVMQMRQHIQDAGGLHGHGQFAHRELGLGHRAGPARA